jgi:hypothetical protein
VLGTSTLGHAADVNPVIKFLSDTVAVAAIDCQMLQRVWQELDYRIDICRVTNGGHMEHV